MADGSKTINDAAANNKNNIAQEVTINLGGGVGSGANASGGRNSATGAGGDCYGMCYQCPKTPSYCAIAQQYLPKEEYFNYGS